MPQRIAVSLLTALTLVGLTACRSLTPAPRYTEAPPLPPIDPQRWQDQETMTWDDYRPIPGIDWADPALPREREMRIALVAVDFPDFPFVITRPRHSDPFGNPQIDPIAREDVPRFYADFFNTPNEFNRGHTINGYWMEQSRGKVGVAPIDAYGPYQLPLPLWQYGLNEWGQEEATPTGERARGRLERDCDELWRRDAGGNIAEQYDAVLRIYAGYDETGVWQEFGEMKFLSPDDITPEFANPNPDMPKWAPTRYVEWTSWLAGAQQWGLSSMRQGENSGTITHEIGHFMFSIGDNNNNPYRTPYRRVGSGPWDMMDRGSFNGPGGPHRRWVVPPTEGAAMPAGLMLRNRMVNGFITEDDVLTLSREGLAASGLAVGRVTARAVEPRPGTFAGIVVRLDGEGGDRTPIEDPALNPFYSGNPDYNFYSLEVVQRIGYDSFCPDSGVLLDKNKDRESQTGGPNGFNIHTWVIDAHPEDINMVDFYRPDGTPVMRTIADYRQLNDALFHAGLNSGSAFEWVDPHNRLHFYVVDVESDADGILVYTLGVRSLDGAGPHLRGAALSAPSAEPTIRSVHDEQIFVLTNTGEAAAMEPDLHPRNADAFVHADVYRLTAVVVGQGRDVQLANALAAVPFGESREIPVYVTKLDPAAPEATVIVTARSESNPNAHAVATLKVR